MFFFFTLGHSVYNVYVYCQRIPLGTPMSVLQDRKQNLLKFGQNNVCRMGRLVLKCNPFDDCVVDDCWQLRLKYLRKRSVDVNYKMNTLRMIGWRLGESGPKKKKKIDYELCETSSQAGQIILLVFRIRKK